LVLAEAVFVEDPSLVDALAEVVDAPEFAVEVKDDGPRGLAVEAGGRGDGADEGIAEEGLVPIVAGGAEEEGVPRGGVAVGKELGVCPSGGAGGVAVVDAEGLAGTVAGGVSVEAETDLAFEEGGSVFKKFEVGGAFPGAAALVVVRPVFKGNGSWGVRPICRVGVVAVNIDAGFVVEEIGGVGGDGDDWKRVSVGSGGVDEVGFCDDAAGGAAGFEGAGAEDMDAGDGAVRGLPFVVVGVAGGRALVGANPGVSGGVVTAGAEFESRRKNG
jgi:hypothetical protein